MNDEPSSSQAPVSRAGAETRETESCAGYGLILSYSARIMGLILPFVTIFVLLDLIGRWKPIFSIELWGTYSEWALALMTPAALFAALDTWRHDRDRREMRDRAREEQREVERVRHLEEKYSCIVLLTRQGLRGEVIGLLCTCSRELSVVRTSTLGSLSTPLVVKQNEFQPIPGAGASDEVEVRCEEGTFILTRAGIRWLA